MAPNYAGDSLNNKTIYFFAGRILPYKTGGEKYNFHLINAAKSLGLDIRGVTLADMPFYKILGWGPLWRLRHIWTCIYLSLQAYRYRSDQLFFDVWLAPYLFPWALFANTQCCWLIVHHLRGHLQGAGWQQKWVSWCERLIIKRSSRILTVSQSSKQQIQEWINESASVSVIFPGFQRIDMNIIKRCNQDKEPFRILYVGAIVRDKGVIDLLHALALLPDLPAWEIHLVGKSDAEPDTLSEIHRLRNQLGEKMNRVVIHGWLDTQALQKLYATSDIFVLPSFWEGYGIVFLEAMAWGLPIVSYNTGAIPEVVIDGKSGILVPLKDIQGLSSAIMRLMNDDDLRKRLGEEGKKTASQHNDWQEMEIQCRDWFSSGT